MRAESTLAELNIHTVWYVWNALQLSLKPVLRILNPLIMQSKKLPKFQEIGSYITVKPKTR